MNVRDDTVVSITKTMSNTIDLAIQSYKKLYSLTPQEMYAIRRKLAQILVQETEISMNGPET